LFARIFGAPVTEIAARGGNRGLDGQGGPHLVARPYRPEPILTVRYQTFAVIASSMKDPSISVRQQIRILCENSAVAFEWVPGINPELRRPVYRVENL
jgi:hypothetical protein